jgi:hypothetical protein
VIQVTLATPNLDIICQRFVPPGRSPGGQARAATTCWSVSVKASATPARAGTDICLYMPRSRLEQTTATNFAFEPRFISDPIGV